MLPPGGRLAIASVHHVMPPGADPFYFDIQEDYRAVGMAGDDAPPPPGEIGDLSGEIEASGLFGPLTVRRIRRRIEARPGGTVRKSMLAVVQVAGRR